MGIKVNPSKAVVAAVSYVEPEALVSWVEVQVLAEATFPDVLAVDVVTPIDLKTLAFTKARKDTSRLSDRKTLAVLKAVVDVVTLIDDTDVEVFIQKFLSDSSSLSEALAKGISKSISGDTLSPNDDGEADVAVDFTKALADATAGFAEFTSRSTDKPLADSFSMLDSVDITYEIVKALADAAEVTEALSRAIDKVASGEQLYLTDNMDGGIEYQFVKVIGELELILDAYGISFEKSLDGDDLVELADSFASFLTFYRVFADVIDEPTDATTKAVDKPLSETLTEPETVALSHAKLLPDDPAEINELISKELDKLILGYEQDYVDPTYFLTQDYVKDVVDGDWVYMTEDSFSREIIYGRLANDTLESGDELQPFQIDKGLADNSTLTEGTAYDLTKPMVGEGLTLLDNMDGNIEYLVVKVIGEAVSSSDAQVIENTVQKADNMLTSDSGLVVVQDYVAPGYFLEDYVGTSTTF